MSVAIPSLFYLVKKVFGAIIGSSNHTPSVHLVCKHMKDGTFSTVVRNQVHVSTFYLFIFHDWDDASCRQIFANTAAAMEPGYSKLMLNEIVLPNKKAPLQMALWVVQMNCAGRPKEDRASVAATLGIGWVASRWYMTAACRDGWKMGRWGDH